MSEPYVVQIRVPDGDPDGTRIVEIPGWIGIGIAFRRSSLLELGGHADFKKRGVYVLTGHAEETEEELLSIYVGQCDNIGDRFGSHDDNKEFWDRGYAFVSHGSDGLNRAHITWLEYMLLKLATDAKQCDIKNRNRPNEPGLSTFDLTFMQGFLRQVLRVFPLLGVHVFERPKPVATPGIDSYRAADNSPADARDTVVVPAQDPGFTNAFLNENAWDAIRISGGMLKKIKYIAAYRTAPVQAVTHYARVDRIVPFGDTGKYQLFFTEPAKLLPHPIPLGEAPPYTIQAPRYTSFAALSAAKQVSDLFDWVKKPADV